MQMVRTGRVFLFVIGMLAVGLLSQAGYAATQVSQFGITWKFDKDYQTGKFANGDWWVVGPVKIVEISPRSTVSGGRTMHGSMLNPMASNDKLGYDSELTGYDASLNVALNVSSSNPLTLQPHSSLVSSISVTSAAAKPQIQSAAILTVLGAPAPNGSFRPPYCGTDKTITFNKSQLDYSSLGSLQKVPATPRLKQSAGDGQTASVERMFERPWIDHRRGWYARWMHPKENMPDYQREMSTQIGEAALMLHLDYTNAEKETLMIRFVQLGIDLFGIVENGGWRNWEPDGGCGSGRKWPILFAGLVLGDDDMASIGSRPQDDPYFGEDAQTFYVSQKDIDLKHTDGFANGNPEPSHDYSQSNLGLPEWGIRHATNPYKDSVSWGASYRVCCTANAWAGFVMACHVMGAKGLWQHDALFDYMDRYMAKETPGTFNRQQSKFAEQMWDTYRSSYGSVWPNTSSNQSPRADAGADRTIQDSNGNGSEQITLDGSGSSDPDGSITSYVWKENGAQIATGVKPAVTLTSGAHSIVLEVTDNKGAKNIDSVVITVATIDTTPPAITSLIASEESVTVVFNEALDEVSAEKLTNYTITNLTITAAVLGADTSRVTLFVSTLLTEDTSYTLRVTNVKDMAGNVMPPTDEPFFYNGGVVSHWRFDEGSGTTTQDATDVANAGELVNGPVWVDGKVNGAIAFDGYDDAVEITTSNFNAAGGTIAFWVYPEAFLNDKSFLFGHATQPWANRIQLYCNNHGELTLGFGDSSARHKNVTTLAVGQWQHIALLWDDINYSVYVNGAPAATGAYSGLTAFSDTADIGNNGNPASRVEALDGRVDEVYVYNRPLTDDEIIGLTNQEPAFLLEPIGNKQVSENAKLTFDVATTSPSVAVELYAHNLPGNPTLVGNTFNWTSTYDCSGSYECTFKATSEQYEDFETVSIVVQNVNRPPVLAAIGNRQATVGKALTFSVSATDADGDAVSYSASAPTGAAFSNGTFTWTPQQNQAGTHTVKFTASDGQLQDSEMITLTVNQTTTTPQDVPIYISDSSKRTSPKPLAGRTVVGKIYAFLVPDTTLQQVRFYLDDINMSGSPIQTENSAPYDFAGGSVSTANSYDTTKLSEGWHTLTVAAVQPGGSVQSGSAEFFVDNDGQGGTNHPPVLETIADQTIEEADALVFTVNATDADGDTLTYGVTNLPQGAAFTNQTFRWTPTTGQAGVYLVRFGVSDGVTSVLRTVTITVSAPADEDTGDGPDGLTGFWQFNETSGTLAQDQSDAANHGVLVNGAVRSGGAVSLDGSNDAVEVTTTGWNAGSGTIVLWAYAKEFSNGKHFLFGHATQPWANRIQLYADRDGKLCLGLGDSSKRADAFYSLPLNTWTAVALTWNGGTYTVYVNGAPVTSGAYSGLSAFGSYGDIGNNGNRASRSEAFNGMIDDVCVFNRALSAGEISYLSAE